MLQTQLANTASAYVVPVVIALAVVAFAVALVLCLGSGRRT
jgi:cation transport ATPase